MFLGTGSSLARISEGNFIPCQVSKVLVKKQKETLYQVKKGDTLWDISNKYNVKLEAILNINNLSKKSILKIGQLIRVPVQGTRVHIISKGETMWDIATHYNVSTKKLIAFNKQKNPCCLKIGDVINIPKPVGRIAAISTPEPSRGLSGISFSWPLLGTITSNYGWRKSGFHHGIDIAGEIGTPIRAAADGKVSYSGYKPIYGNVVFIDHADEKQTVYAHAQKIYIKEKQIVKKGQVIATVGISGKTTGPHLHFEVREKGKTYNPIRYLR